jgi:hypothetical protein
MFSVGFASTVSKGVGHLSRAPFGFLKLSVSSDGNQKPPTEERSWCRRLPDEVK